MSALGDYSEDEIEEGEKYLRSPMTGQWYRVTRWVDKGDGKFVAISKDEVDESEVPDSHLEENSGGDA